MGRVGTDVAKGSQIQLQASIDASDVIGRWDWDIPNDLLYADATVALLFSVDPATAQGGVPLSLFLAGIHPEDRAKTAEVIAISARAGRSYVQEYRVYSADGAMRWVLARGLIHLDKTGRPLRGTGLLIDITPNRADEADHPTKGADSLANPLEEAAEHCLAARHAIQKISEPLLKNMIDMLLLEIGRRLSKTAIHQRRTRMN